jgi:hypothetical protein
MSGWGVLKDENAEWLDGWMVGWLDGCSVRYKPSSHLAI